MPNGRFEYSGLPERPAYDWPGGKRLAVYVAVNLEVFSFGEGLGACIAPGGPQPDVLNYAWREWGNRVGAWRLLHTLQARPSPLELCPYQTTSRAFTIFVRSTVFLRDSLVHFPEEISP